MTSLFYDLQAKGKCILGSPAAFSRKLQQHLHGPPSIINIATGQMHASLWHTAPARSPGRTTNPAPT